MGWYHSLPDGQGRSLSVCNYLVPYTDLGSQGSLATSLSCSMNHWVNCCDFCFQALGFLQKNGAEFGLRRMKRIPVSGAFHTELMRSAEPTFRKVLKEIRLQEPIIPVHSNVTSDRYGKIKGAILKLLALQISKPVKWEQTMHAIYSRSAGTQFPRTYEVGPGAQLGTLLKMVNKSAWQHYSNVEV